jgi:sterol 3beta-glucosyltransferase
VERLASSLRQLVSDTRLRGKASVIGERIRSEDGVSNAVKMIYRDLDYAKTLFTNSIALCKDQPAGKHV